MIFSFQRAIVGGEIQTTRYGPPLMESVPENIPLPKVKLLPYRNYIFYSVANFLTILAIILFPTVINRTEYVTLKISFIFTATTLVWLGMVLAISFMESWKKFQAVTLTRKVGLDVGRLIFFSLNQMEILACCFMLLLFHGFEQLQDIFTWKVLYFLVFQLALQVLWLQPSLDDRGIQICEGNNPGPSLLHLFYVLLECGKVLCFLRISYQFLLSI